MRSHYRGSLDVFDGRWFLAGQLPFSFNCLLLITCLIISDSLCSTRAMALNPYVSGIKLSGNRIEDQTFFAEIKSVIGGRAELPCNLTLPSPDDAIQLIFWYRGNHSRVPIYTVDARTSALINATHFPSDIFSPMRAHFDVMQLPIALLQIDPVLESDHGDYRCRVDFRWGRTINSYAPLHIIVPPKQIVIRNQNGKYVQNSIIGPYDENTDILLTCETAGGIPPPMLQWYKNGVMIDGSYVVGKNGSVLNELTIYKLSPRDLLSKYVCQAGNFNSSSPIAAHVSLDINLSPQSVRIVTNKVQLTAGRKVDIRCESSGSKPAAKIEWLKNNITLLQSSKTITSGNKTESSITLMPSMHDNNVHLLCRAYNVKLPDKKIDDVWLLHVVYKPHVALRIVNNSSKGGSNGGSRNNDDDDENNNNNKNNNKITTVVEEGNELVIECQVAANPSIVDLQILHDAKPFYSHESLDAEQQNFARTLLSSANSTHRGQYQCVASNQEGVSRSNEIQLDVRYAPFCALHLEKTSNFHALSINESILLRCQVEANPAAVQFYWTLNQDTLLDNYLLAQSDGGDDEFLFSPISNNDFGKIRCWAKNEVGIQRESCVFVIAKAGPPSSLMGCSVTNKTTTNLTVECVPGDSGGSAQRFHANVFRTNANEERATEEHDLAAENKPNLAASLELPSTTLVTMKSKINLTSDNRPTFYLSNLEPGTTYIIELFASNFRGQSDRSRLFVTTLFTKNTKLISSSLQEIEYDPIYSIFVVALFALFLIVIVAFVSCRLRKKQINRQNKHRTEEQIKQNFAFHTSSPDRLYIPHQDKEQQNADGISTKQQQHQTLLSSNNFLRNESNKKLDIISFEELSNSKLSLYVINEIKNDTIPLKDVLSKTNSVMMSAKTSQMENSDAATFSLPFDSNSSEHMSTIYSSQPFSYTRLHHQQNHHHQYQLTSADTILQQPPNLHPQHFFISPTPADTILYTSAATALQPQVLSINDKIDGIVLNGSAHFSYYHSGNVPTGSINDAIVLHHPQEHQQQQQQQQQPPSSPQLSLQTMRACNNQGLPTAHLLSSPSSPPQPPLSSSEAVTLQLTACAKTTSQQPKPQKQEVIKWIKC